MVRSRRTQIISAICISRREGCLQRCSLSNNQAGCMYPSFVKCYAVQAHSIASDFDFKLMSKKRSEGLHFHTIPSFASSKSPFWLGSRESTYVFHLSKESQPASISTIRDQCEPSTPRHDSKMGGLTHNIKRLALPFLCSSRSIRAGLPSPFGKSCRRGVAYSMQVASWARTRCCSRSPNLAPNSSGSESLPTTSWAAPWADSKRNPPLAVDTGLSETERGHWTQEACKGPYGIRWDICFTPWPMMALSLRV